MFKVIIADDEGLIRRGIISMLKRNIPDEMEFYEAGTGNAALELVHEINPALIITDIRMPGLSGLDLIEELRRSHQKTSVIIISGYEDFKYAQKAIALGVKKYVTKPVNKPEFIELVNQELQNQKKRLLFQEKEFHKKLASNAMEKELRERLLLQLMNAKDAQEAQDAMKHLKELQVTFHATVYTCVMIQYHSDAALDYLDFSIANIAQEYLNNSVHSDYMGSAKFSENELVILVAGQGTKSFLSDIRSMFFEIIGKLIDFYHYDFFAGIGNMVYEPELISRCLGSSQKAANCKIFGKEQRIQFYGTLERGTPPDDETVKQLENAMRSMNGVRIVQVFSAFTKKPYTKQNLLAFEKMYYRLEQELLHQISIRQYQANHKMPRLCSFKDLWSIPAMNQGILSFITDISSHTCVLPVSQNNQKLLEDIIRYVQEHLGETIDLNTVADAFGKNPAYISSLFKKGLQQGFNDYLTNERMSLSKKYLKDNSLPIHEIAKLCGYSNPKYYSVVFKKNTGLTPGKFRELQRL